MSKAFELQNLCEKLGEEILPLRVSYKIAKAQILPAYILFTLLKLLLLGLGQLQMEAQVLVKLQKHIALL